ncbi:MAG: hypothetical protein ABIJ12_10880 [bacterium]
MRREVPLLITGIVGIAFVLQYFIPHWPFSQLNTWFSDWFSIISAFAIWLGALNLMKISFQKISRKKSDWGYSVVIVLSFIVIAVIGFYEGKSFREPGTHFSWLYEFVYTPLSATMFAILAFFVASASFRGFRARSLPATILLLSASLILISRSAVGGYLWDQIPQFADWVRNYPSMSARRAILIGIGLGSLTTSLRVILGIERTWLGGEK